MQEATVTEKIGFAAVSRRDAIRLIATTPASGVVLATSLPAAASAKAIASAAAATGQHSLGSAAAGQSLADLAARHFEPLVGQTFSVAGEAATLTEVRRGLASRAPFRRQFALTFSAPRHGHVLSDIVPVSHPAIGCHDLHVTQIGSAKLEICFS
jgi:hypothetical protein